MRKRNSVKEENETVDEKNDSKAETSGDEKDSNLEAIKSELEEDSNDENSDLDSLEVKLNNKEKDLQELNDMFLRLKADFTNYKRRMEKEKEAIYGFAAEGLVTPLLQILDNFERALTSVSNNEKDSSLFQGVEMIYNQFFDALKKSGLEEIKALNEKFDPNFHHGVAQEQSDDHDEDTVVEVFQKGYMLKEKVIRPSMVKISKK